MGIVFASLGLIWLLLNAGPSGAEATFGEGRSSAECSEERYKDFFWRLQELEKRNEARERYAVEMKDIRLKHALKVEEARREFVKSRVRAVEDPRLEQEWNAEQAARKEQHEMARRRLVQMKQAEEKTCKHQVPGLKEFDLED